MRAESAAGHLLEDGAGTLADGSTWERISGEEKGDNGYWCRRAALPCPLACAQVRLGVALDSACHC